MVKAMRTLAAGIVLSLWVGYVSGQGFSRDDPANSRHRDFAGKPCLDIAGLSQAHVKAFRVFNHVIEINNHCTQRIKVKVCYRKTERCVTMDVSPFARKQQLLGSFPAMSQFQFDFKEQF